MGALSGGASSAVSACLDTAGPGPLLRDARSGSASSVSGLAAPSVKGWIWGGVRGRVSRPIHPARFDRRSLRIRASGGRGRRVPASRRAFWQRAICRWAHSPFTGPGDAPRSSPLSCRDRTIHPVAQPVSERAPPPEGHREETACPAVRRCRDQTGRRMATGGIEERSGSAAKQEHDGDRDCDCEHRGRPRCGWRQGPEGLGPIPGGNGRCRRSDTNLSELPSVSANRAPSDQLHRASPKPATVPVEGTGQGDDRSGRPQ